VPANTTHSVFRQPGNPEESIWRYMDFTKYVDLLQRRALYFARSDCLGDPFEGSYSRANQELRREVYGDRFEQIQQHVVPLNRWFCQWTFLSCWHMNAGESAAMWKLYAKTAEAVAIRSTYARLMEVLPGEAFMGLVTYIDYNRDWLPEGNVFYPFVHKRLSFQHEQEVRALIQSLPTKNDSIDSGAVNAEVGRLVPVELPRLVEEVLVAPTSPDWFLRLVEDVTKKYELDVRVRRSELDSAPVY